MPTPSIRGRKKLRIPTPQFATHEQTNALVQLWILRLLIKYNAVRPLCTAVGHTWCAEDELSLLAAIGLGHYAYKERNEESEVDVSDLPTDVYNRHKQAEEHASQAEPPGDLARNIAHLAAMAGLDEVSEKILLFVSVLHHYEILDKTSEFVKLSHVCIYTLLSHLLDIEKDALRRALHPDAVLARSGLMTFDPTVKRASQLTEYFSIYSEKVLSRLFQENIDPSDLLHDVAIPAPEPELAMNDFVHLGDDLDNLREYLQSALQQHSPGVNILLYGPPGTGKTELTRCLARHIEARLLELPMEDFKEQSLRSHTSRLADFCVAQNLLRNSSDTVLLFDEIEDVFSSNPVISSSANRQKGKTNHLLENNPVPAIWVSNQTDCLDPAFIRRFDIVLEIPVPPRSQRLNIIQRVSGESLSTTMANHLASSDVITPALVTRALKVVNVTARQASEQRDTRTLNLINGTLAAQGYQSLTTPPKHKAQVTYNPEYANADIPLDVLAQGIARAGSARLCLYGPPGTGKTAFGHWLATQLDQPLLVKRCSDLIAPLVGMTERNIARAFREATQEHSVLLIDEVDSFLQDRKGARHSWEITAVNEMLTQMEAFEGIFIASTNLMDNLDQAALRRFDAKLRLGYLRPEQSQKLLADYCSNLAIPGHLSKEGEYQLRALSSLTPGDFAAVARRHRFQPYTHADELVQGLVQECAIKAEKPARPIGFVH